jgi:hypothetical protein
MVIEMVAGVVKEKRIAIFIRYSLFASSLLTQQFFSPHAAIASGFESLKKATASKR